MSACGFNAKIICTSLVINRLGSTTVSSATAHVVWRTRTREERWQVFSFDFISRRFRSLIDFYCNQLAGGNSLVAFCMRFNQKINQNERHTMDADLRNGRIPLSVCAVNSINGHQRMQFPFNWFICILPTYDDDAGGGGDDDVLHPPANRQFYDSYKRHNFHNSLRNLNGRSADRHDSRSTATTTITIRIMAIGEAIYNIIIIIISNAIARACACAHVPLSLVTHCVVTGFAFTFMGICRLR